MAGKVAIGIQDFSTIIENNCFYVDKTDFIKEWWENLDTVTLITRPRRFGKTLTMSMTEQFFSFKYSGRSDLFENLKIWKDEKYRKLQGAYPVIFLSFANIKGGSFETVRKKICQEIVNLYEDHRYLLNGGLFMDGSAEYFNRVSIDLDNADLEAALGQLSRYLYKYYGKKAVILLDEYDTPMQEAYVNGYWDEMAVLMRGLFNSAFKTNPYLERGLLTGITRISKESIFSDLNNLEVITTTSGKYSTAFGFTEKEVFHALDEYGLQNEKKKVREWYDGFRFGNSDTIYNPWSIINFLDKRKFMNYWTNTSSNSLIGKLILEAGPEVKIVMEDLIRGDAFSTYIDEEIVYNQLEHNENAIWSLLLAGGYLKAVENIEDDEYGMKYKLMLTNLEVKKMFLKIIQGWFSDGRTEYNHFEKALLSGSLKEMNIYMNKISLNTFSYFDTGRKASETSEPERFYHGFVLGLLVNLQKRYEVTSNRESGYGRYDVMLTPLDVKKDGIILEFKVLDDECSLDDTVKAALKQIMEQKYASALETKGINRSKIRIYGFAFSGKKVLIDGGYLNEVWSLLGPSVK